MVQWQAAAELRAKIVSGRKRKTTPVAISLAKEVR
jgi:hypothetical protein